MTERMGFSTIQDSKGLLTLWNDYLRYCKIWKDHSLHYQGMTFFEWLTTIGYELPEIGIQSTTSNEDVYWKLKEVLENDSPR